jgi:hypothetical protein
MASLDRFFKEKAIKNILLIPKWSRLEVKNFGPVFECKMAAKPFENRTKLSGFRMASLA